MKKLSKLPSGNLQIQCGLGFWVIALAFYGKAA